VIPFAHGLGREAPGAYQIEVHADDTREDPLLLDVLRAMRGPFSVAFGLGAVLEDQRYVIVMYPGDARTFMTNRPLDRQRNPVTGECRVELRNVRSTSSVVFSGDLNGDGRPDFILYLSGEMGCGGPRLYLSSPEGWFEAGLSNNYC
jgi:hypothetical protein